MKYYTPELSEFHIGFEYQIKDWWTLQGESGQTGNDISVNTDPLLLPDYSGFVDRELTAAHVQLANKQFGVDSRCEVERICTGIKDGTVRVKYLDKSDIISLGYRPYNINCFTDDKLRIVVDFHTYYVYIYSIYNDNTYEKWYQGYIRNKSELKKILKQLNKIIL